MNGVKHCKQTNRNDAEMDAQMELADVTAAIRES